VPQGIQNYTHQADGRVEIVKGYAIHQPVQFGALVSLYVQGRVRL
jgi:hypothetical protein